MQSKTLTGCAAKILTRRDGIGRVVAIPVRIFEEYKLRDPIVSWDCRSLALSLASLPPIIPVVMGGSKGHAEASRPEQRNGPTRYGALESRTADSRRA